ncbi:MAG: hypothetical protein ABTQ34_02560 [Bdellovibrionales bacterium]
MNNTLAVDFLGDTLKRAGARKPMMFPNKYRELTMAPQSGIVPLNIEKNGTPTGEVAIDIDPFYRNRLLQRHQRLLQRLNNNSSKSAPATAKQPAAATPLMRNAKRAQQRITFNAANLTHQPTNANDTAPKHSTLASLPSRLIPTAPGSKAQLRVETAKVSPAKNIAELRAMENVPAQGVKVPAKDLRLPPEYMLRMRRQRLLALSCA